MSQPTATQRFQDDIRVIRGLITQYEALRARSSSMAPAVLTELLAQVEIHARLEKRLLFPHLRNSRDEPLAEIADSAEAAHRGLRKGARRIRAKNPDKDLLDDWFKSLLVQLDFEEQRLLPCFEARFPEPSAALGAKAKALKEELMNLPQFRSAYPAIVQNPGGGEQRRKVI